MMKHSRKKIFISADTTALKGELGRIFENLKGSGQFPFPVEMIESLKGAEESHLLFFEADPERLDDSRKELKRLLAKSRASVVLICSREYDNLELARQFGIGNILLPASLNESVIRAITINLLGDEFFGFRPFFPIGYPLFDREYLFSGDFQLQSFQKRYFGDFAAGLAPEERDPFFVYTYELMANALSYGFYGVTPEQRDENHRIFLQEVFIPEEKEIRVRIVRDEEKYGIGISDKTGSLTLQRVLEKIRRQTAAPGESVPEGLYDLSGRGLFILSKQARLIINILRRVKTEVLLLRYNDPSLNRYQSLIINEKMPTRRGFPESLHQFIPETQ